MYIFKKYLNPLRRHLAYCSKTYAIGFSILLILLVTWALWDDRDRIFTIDVQTEKVLFVISDPALSEWQVGHARFLSDPFAEENAAVVLHKDAFLQLEKYSEVEVQRHGIQATNIVLRHDQDSIGTLINGDQIIKLGSWASFTLIPEVTPLVLPFRGTMTVGDDVTVGVNSILLAGNVTVLEAMLIKNTRYTAGNTSLDRGDRISVWAEKDRFWFFEDGVEPAIVEGFIRVEPTDQNQFTEAENAMQLVAHGNASYVRVDRLGSAGYQIRAPRWARFLYDPFLAFAAALGAIFFAAIEIYAKTKELLTDCKPDRH